MSVLGKLFGSKRSTAAPVPTVFAVTFRVESGAEPLPPPLIGAFVSTYAIAPTTNEAVAAGFRKLEGMGYSVVDVDPRGISFPLDQWERATAEWSKLDIEFPGRTEAERRFRAGEVVLSPFAGFDEEKGSTQ